MSALRWLVLAAASGVGVAAGCGDGESGEGNPDAGPDAATPAPPPIEVLFFSRTAGFRHASIDDAQRVFASLPLAEDIAVTQTEDPEVFTDDGLAPFDVVLFANTTGDVLDDAQQEALQRFVRGGNGFVGVHSAADTEHDWPWYGKLVGAYFVSHALLPVQTTVTSEDQGHPSTDHLAQSFEFTDEWYNFDRNPRIDHHVLLTIDESPFADHPTFPPDQPYMGADHPVAWYKEFEGGRSFYTNLGHEPQTWYDIRFLEHVLEGIRWAAQPVQYSQAILSRRMRNPMALDVAPDGRVFFIERDGEVLFWDPNTGKTEVAAALEVGTEAEAGLLGIALHPDFESNSLVYLYLAEPIPEPPPSSGPRGENVLARFVLGADGKLDLGSKEVLLRVPSERECCHEGGDLEFAPDGTLFLSVGDNTNPHASQGSAPLDERPGQELDDAQRTAPNPFDLRGKILRLNDDGSIPDGNLFPKSGDEGRPEIYTMGNRNPFRIAVDSNTGRLYWGEIGPDAVNDSARGPRGFDELNLADTPGDYGWPFCIADNVPYADWDFATDTSRGSFSCDGKRGSLLAYDYLTVNHLALGSATSNPEATPGPLGNSFTGRSVIAGSVYRPPGDAPFALPGIEGAVLLTDWTRDILASVHVSDAGGLQAVRRIVPFFPFRRPIDVDVGPDGAIYVLDFGTGFLGDNSDAGLQRIEHSATGAIRPVADIVASPLGGAAPLEVSFSSGVSVAHGLGPGVAAVEWDFDNDGVVDSTERNPVFTYEAAGTFFPRLVVEGTSGRRSAPTVVEIVVGNEPPTVEITSPADGATAQFRELVTLEGRVTDPEDGSIDCESYEWDIRLGHNSHSHPTATDTGCTTTLAAEAAGHDPSEGLVYAIELRYTDSGGLTSRHGITIRVAPP